MSGTDRVAIAPILRVDAAATQADHDLVAVEAPIGVVLHHPRAALTRSLGVLMRTPGHDEDLVTGLLFTEGVIQSAGQVVSLTAGADRVDVHLDATVDLDAWSADRATLATSACGLCGRLTVRSVDALADLPSRPFVRVPTALLLSLPARLREDQAVFAETGGLHAAGLFAASGDRIGIREDVGRHNAVDKVIGLALRTGALRERASILVVSSRVAFEIVQKASAAGIALIVAVGAPSDLAIDAARAANITLIGFARDGRFNV